MHAELGMEPDGYERDLRWVAGDLGLMEEMGVSGDRPPRVAFSMDTMSEGYGREASEIRAGILGSKPLRSLKDGEAWKKFRKKLERRESRPGLGSCTSSPTPPPIGLHLAVSPGAYESDPMV